MQSIYRVYTVLYSLFYSLLYSALPYFAARSCMSRKDERIPNKEAPTAC